MEYHLLVNQEEKTINADIGDHEITLKTDSSEFKASFSVISDHQFLLNMDGQNFNAFIHDVNGTKTVIIKGRSYKILDADLVEQNTYKKTTRTNHSTMVASPMPAVVISVLARVGDRVKKNQGLVIVSAMKMETTLFAPFDGTIKRINIEEGDKVMPNDILVDIEKEEDTL